MTLTLPPNDPRYHVFAVSDGGDPIASQTYLEGNFAGNEARLRAAFGAPIDPAHIEVFDLSDIAPLGLRDYLQQAHDVPADAMAADAGRLDGLSGRVIVLAPRALADVPALEPEAHLTHIGAYGAPVPDETPAPMPRAQTAPRQAEPAAPAPGPGLDSRTILWIVVAALAVVILLVLLI